MYTRSRQSQNFTGGTPQRNQQAGAAAANQQQYQQGQQAAYNQQGNYQGANQNPQAAYKQQQGQQQGNNTPYKQQPQQQQVATPQQQQARAQQAKAQPNPQQLQQIKQQQAQQQPAAQPQRLKPILKSSANVQSGQQAAVQAQAPVQVQAQAQPQNQQAYSQPQPAANNGMDTSEVAHESMESDAQDVPKWRRKVPGLKVNRKLKRLRMNQRLRKTLQPKNAIMVLNEMKTGVQFTFPESQTAMPNSLFLVHAEIEGKTYIGQGVSKPLARQNAAENALKSLLLEKMTAAAMKARLDADAEGPANPAGGDEAENKEGTEGMETNAEEGDEIPWSSLASFALYKLFLEWQNQGTVVPVPRPGLSPGKVKKEASSKPVVQKELPANALSIHPVMLLNQMKPGVTYTEVSRIGNPPNTMFTLGIDIDGQEYTGCAKNKKDAKKLTAKAALLALYNLVYPDDKEADDVHMA